LFGKLPLFICEQTLNFKEIRLVSHVSYLPSLLWRIAQRPPCDGGVYNNTMSLNNKDLKRIDRIARKHTGGVAENLKWLEEELDAKGVYALRQIGVFEDMLDIMSEWSTADSADWRTKEMLPTKSSPKRGFRAHAWRGGHAPTTTPAGRLAFPRGALKGKIWPIVAQKKASAGQY
jgi:hypothetical protein